MAREKHEIYYLKDYSPPDYTVETVELRFELGEESTRVHSRLEIAGNYNRGERARPLVLVGQELRLISVALDGRVLADSEFLVDDESLTIPDVPWKFTIEIETEIRPQENTSLEGLYKSSGNFCTQCEAEGFRKITYFPDRPDVMSRYTTTIVADRIRYPVLLSNGNLVKQGELDDGRHFAKWQDPFRKPSYLYALVAGDLVKIEDFFVTRSGRRVSLRIYVQEHNASKCGHAMESLKKAMKWDEEAYGREYDLDTYMIFAADDFNFGAMENKGLNIFNSKYVLARPETATDADFQAIEDIIGHEYFHNWTGNRITCRDWFQLSLKEGLTIFRDQEFSADMGSRAVKRIADVRLLRARQFPEDAGPLAHPVRPESYIEINNFYTMTVYYKGAEIVRMIHTLLGPERFRRGMDLYFERHDGQAVTVEDFVRAMEDAGKTDLGQFRLWHSQTGTPRLQAVISLDPDNAVCTLTVRQSYPDGWGRAVQGPAHIPLAVGLVDENGRDIPLLLEGEDPSRADTNRVLQLRRETETFRFLNIRRKPVPSLLRGFSAPVRLDYDYSDEELMFLLAHDSDPFNRWEAGQRLASGTILKLIRDYREGRELSLPRGFVEAFAGVLADACLDRAFVAEAMTLPSEDYLAELMDIVDVEAIHAVREYVRGTMASRLRRELLAIFKSMENSGGYSIDAASIGARSLKNLCLSYLMTLKEQPVIDLCMEQFRRAGSMTDVMGALGPLAQTDCPERREALSVFHDKWKDDPLVMDKWFSIQATSRLPGTLMEVERLLGHPAFDIRNPNRVRSLIGSFCESNPLRFHEEDGSGYGFLGEQVARLNDLNPQVAARILGALSKWRKFDGKRRELMKEQLRKILALPNLAKDVYEIAAKSLNGK
ncbi:MAG TPA: aminopeptidase N [Geobacteraceae bacterium]|nr:aminopeptidase N [Geobacteraceae bacterium]